MTGTAWPIDASAGAPSYTGALQRHLDSPLLMNGTADSFGVTGGQRGGAGTVVTASALAWSMTAGAFIAYPRYSATQGPYRVDFAGTEAGAYSAPHATYSRRDILSVVIDDAGAGDGSGARQARVVYTAGTASASPVSPAVPARGTLLATLVVPPSGAPTVIMGPVAVAAGGILPVADQAERLALTAYDGMVVWQSDLDQLWGYTASAWTFLGGKMVRVWENLRSTSPSATDSYPSGSFTGLLTYTLPATAPQGRYLVDVLLSLYGTAATTGNIRVLVGATNISYDDRFDVLSTSLITKQTWMGSFVHAGGAAIVGVQHLGSSGTITVANSGAKLRITYVGPE